MAIVRATLDVPYPTSATEALWYDTGRWPAFVDGFGVLKTVEGNWPHVGARVVWDTTSDGRGRVTQTVSSYTPRLSCVTQVRDEKQAGVQTVAFKSHPQGTAVQLTLDYSVSRRTPLSPLVDLLYVRRTQRESLQRTLRRFALELRDEVDPSV